MKTLIYALAVIVAVLMLGCNKSTSPETTLRIFIEILQNGTLHNTYVITEEDDENVYPIIYELQQIGELEIDVSRYTDYISGDEINVIYTFHSIARKNGCYSKFNTIIHYDTLRIDYQQDFDECNASLNCGTISGTYWGLLQDTGFYVWKDSVFIDSIVTDDQGRFVTDIAADDYMLTYEIVRDFYEIEFQLIAGYSDYTVPISIEIDAKPNIYLYPQATIDLDVNISFPLKGEVTTSIPQFPDEWQNLRVEPDGTINGQFNYLFYECVVPAFSQKTAGWVVKREELEAFFIDNLQETGFIQAEIDDFIEHWIPRLLDAEYYAIYPQYNEQLDPLIRLEFSQQPDNVLRLSYYVQELDSNDLELQAPVIPPFERAGFAVAEWGLIRADRSLNLACVQNGEGAFFGKTTP
ncbi:MAG: hypothetical protein K8R90_06605 [Candidatus Cloacimonetes bacterium]|nr:hypothetical protein [Candidatus Cloacimonadota bacterium]